jgi:hypothetical protein
MEKREQETDRNRLDLLRRELPHRRPQCRLIERLEHLAAEIDAFAHFAGAAARHQHGRPVVGHVENGRPVGPRLLTDLVNAAEACGHQEPGTRALAFEQRIGANGRAMTEEADVGRAPPLPDQRLDPLQNGKRRVVGRGRDFGDRDRAGRLVKTHEIRERAARIDRNPVFAQWRSFPACTPSASGIGNQRDWGGITEQGRAGDRFRVHTGATRGATACDTMHLRGPLQPLPCRGASSGQAVLGHLRGKTLHVDRCAPLADLRKVIIHLHA